MRNADLATLQTVARLSGGQLIAASTRTVTMSFPSDCHRVAAMELRLLGYRTRIKGTLLIATKKDSQDAT